MFERRSPLSTQRLEPFQFLHRLGGSLKRKHPERLKTALGLLRDFRDFVIDQTAEIETDFRLQAVNPVSKGLSTCV